MKRKNKKSKYFYSLIGVFLLFIMIIGIVSSLGSINKQSKKTKELFTVESRTKNIEETVITSDSSYRVIGWLRMEGTNIDYPVLYSTNRSFDFPVELESYVWSENFDPNFHNMINLMGHNIFNLSSTPKIHSEKFKRLEELMAYVYYDFAKENKYIQFTIDGKDYVYKIFAVDFIKNADVTSFPAGDDYDEEEMKEQISLLRKESLYQYDVDVNEKDSLISIYTCTRFFGTSPYYQVIVNGRLLRDNEEITDYKVTTTKKYSKIEKKLKGDDNNEEDSL